MIKLENISLSFGDQVVFDDISWNISPTQKVGLVGRNGSGKTTLLKVIADQQHVDSGRVCIPKSFKIAFMPQDVVLISEKTILDESLTAFEKIEPILDELKKIEVSIAEGQKSNEIMEQYAHLHQELHELEYEAKCAEAKKILSGLGFKEAQFGMKVSQLSVGWKMRLVLAKLLLQKADFYLFDEPTNHLDLIAKDWFAQFLQDASFGFVLVSHDKYFLDTVCEYICDISLGKLTMYTGNYSKYLVQKEANMAMLEKKYEEQQKFLKKKMATIDRFRYKASKAKMAQSMLRSLEKVDKIELDHKQKVVQFSLPPTKPSGKIVLTAKNLGFSFGNKEIFDHASFQVKRGHKVAIVAPNGTGKTTLLNIIMGKYKPQNGEFTFGHNVKPALFEQDQNRSLNLHNTILEEVEDACPNEAARLRVRNLLGAFLFSGDDVNKRISVLSGGEKNRVAMVKVLLQNANFLILDEPTNHLDIESKNVLLDVLKKFDGTILFVSHDRSFLNDLATDILDLTPHNTFNYEGNYDDFLYYKQNISDGAGKKQEKAQKQKKEHKGDKNQLYSQQKQLKRTEAAIERVEKKIKDLMRTFENLQYGTEKYNQATEKLQKLQSDLREKQGIWENLMMELEDS